MVDFHSIGSSFNSELDTLKNRYGGLDQMRARYEELKRHEGRGALTGGAKDELNALKTHFEGHSQNSADV